MSLSWGDSARIGLLAPVSIVRDAGVAARTGAGLMCQDPGTAARAVESGIAAPRLLVRTVPAQLETASRAGWATLVDLDEHLDEHTGPAYSLARAEAAAAVCAWLGASVIRTRHVTEIRRCVDMTESILGRRPPAWALRGLA